MNKLLATRQHSEPMKGSSVLIVTLPGWSQLLVLDRLHVTHLKRGQMPVFLQQVGQRSVLQEEDEDGDNSPLKFDFFILS